MAIDFESIQHTIGYKFRNTDLLQQAFVRRSYSEENGGQNNEVLEFIGDKALDFAVIRKMMERFGMITEDKQWYEFKLRNPRYFQTKLKEGKFTDIKKDLVEKKALARCMNDLGFHTQLIMGQGDIRENVQEQDSVKEDLFEAIIGAVALDSNWNMDVITGVVERMIDFDSYFDNDMKEDDNYVGRFQTWYQKNVDRLRVPDYQYEGIGEDFYCFLEFPYQGYLINARGEGTSQPKARMNCAEKACQLLEQYGLIQNPFKEAVGEADYNRAKAQLNELVQKKMIQPFTYRSPEQPQYGPDGNTVWTVTLEIDGVDASFINEHRSKDEAQKMCAYAMLRYLMGEHPED